MINQKNWPKINLLAVELKVKAIYQNNIPLEGKFIIIFISFLPAFIPPAYHFLLKGTGVEVPMSATEQSMVTHA